MYSWSGAQLYTIGHSTRTLDELMPELLLDFRIAMVFGPGIINLGIKSRHTGSTGQIDKPERGPATDHIHDTTAIRGRNEKDLTMFQVEPILH